MDLDYRDFVETEERYLRPTEVDALIADTSKARSKLGWEAKTNWKQLSKIMVNHDLEKLQ
jgi:GDPmannose 4,6-dehydratase